MSYNDVYCSKFSDKNTVLHQTKSGNEMIRREIHINKGDNGKGERRESQNQVRLEPRGKERSQRSIGN